VLDEHSGSDTLLYLPPGRYDLEDTWSFLEFERFGLVGRDATIVPPEGFDGTIFDIGEEGQATGFRFSGIEFDFTATSTGGRPLDVAVEEELYVTDVSVRGLADVDQDLFRFDVTDDEGVGEIVRLSVPDGGDPRWGITGCELGDMNQGAVRFVDCHIAGFPDNGLYADPPEGIVEVVGGRYENNGVASIRLNAAPGSSVRGAHVRCDASPEGFDNMRGIRLRGGDDITIEGCLVEMLDVTSSDGGIAVSNEMGRVTVRDTHVHVDADNVNAVRIKPFSGNAEDGRVDMDGVLVTGAAAGGAAIQVAERNGFRFRNLCVLQYGDRRNGVNADRADGTILDSTFAVRGDPFRLSSSDVDTSNLRVCREPTRGGGANGCERSCRQLRQRLLASIPRRED
jgi:hypothetical protein